MNRLALTPHVSYCGVNDRTTPLFEGLWPLPKGVTYNSYVVAGSEAVALIDGCEAGYTPEYIDNVKAILGERTPDYLVINHMEPDHSGAIPRILAEWPAIKVVGNSKTLDMVRGFYRVVPDSVEVKENDTISLGDVTLRFIMTPMAHWPETMMTLLEEEAVLFSGDVFGCFGALDGAIVDSDMADARRFFPEMERYYACIVAKYGTFVLKAYDKLAKFNIQTLCSTHGPVWRSLRDEVGGLWLRMAKFEANPGVVIVYGSMYGNTAALAEALAARLVEEGVREIRIHNLSTSPLSDVLADVMRFKGLAIASPTYNTEIFPPVATLAQALLGRGIKDRALAVMGSFTWGGQAVRKLRALFEGSGFALLDPSPEMKQALLADKEAELSATAHALAEAIK